MRGIHDSQLALPSGDRWPTNLILAWSRIRPTLQITGLGRPGNRRPSGGVAKDETEVECGDVDHLAPSGCTRLPGILSFSVGSVPSVVKDPRIPYSRTLPDSPRAV